MWKSVSLALVLLCLIEVQGYQNRRISYDGYAVYRVSIRNAYDAKTISRLKKVSGIDFWSHIDLQNHRVDIMVAPKRSEEFIRFLAANDLDWNPIIEDVGKVSELLEHLSHEEKPARMRSDHGSRNISRYMGYKQIINYAESLANIVNPENQQKLVQIEIIGKSYLGADVVMIKVSSDHRKQKPIILMDAGMHAREWAGPPTVLYLVQQLVENYAKNKDVLEDVDFYIIPVANPDGYEYSRHHDRMWRKTRSDQGSCIGTDGNRNFDYFWGLSGTSSNPCSDTFKGPSPFSEVESQNIRNVGLKYKERLLGYVAVHTYGGYLLYPWGYSKELPTDWEKLDECATSFSKAVENYSGTKYIHGTSARVLYEAAGGSDDWMKGKLNVPFTYTLEIASSDEEGFHLIPEKLPFVAEETFEGFKALAECFLSFMTPNETPETVGRRRYSRGG